MATAATVRRTTHIINSMSTIYGPVLIEVTEFRGGDPTRRPLSYHAPVLTGSGI